MLLCSLQSCLLLMYIEAQQDESRNASSVVSRQVRKAHMWSAGLTICIPCLSLYIIGCISTVSVILRCFHLRTQLQLITSQSLFIAAVTCTKR